MSSDLRRPPRDEYLENLPTCVNCGQPFEEHEKEGDPPYRCPYEYQRQPHYGYPAGTDFHPDPELCSEEEMARGTGVGVTVFPTLYYCGDSND